ncbi:MAG TPA: acyl-CoA dehydrogenase [Gammaproteobacteria bacterium]|jgi:(2S)-methylsuccinyl-CoA dehydrogenase|nr:acyl-CoA dehydrogenase family protein [Gammaproteobacteria bacterium]MDP6731704.1 acyl-CoA dehydrogenase family protein [Gammaproteobacteria bacterium]HAJ77217.1 acyl-CoA dehydrogenase [Gammaproteobacteria bacterium]
MELRTGGSISERIEVASVIFERLKELTEESARVIKGNCTRDGKFLSERLDLFQNGCYELAFCEAEIAAARAGLVFLNTGEEHALRHDIVLMFCAETIKSVLNRFLSHGTDLGVHRSRAQAIYDDPQTLQFLDGCSSAPTVAHLGACIVEEGLTALPSSLGEEKLMVRDTFSRFTDDVVAPLAEEIHRKDTDIPEQIITAVAELGCFGTCIPERFGGLQPDDHSDSLGMIIVTEELSRGSLGAAGSLITRPEIAARALLAGGTEAQQQKWLPPLACGEMLCAISITEPNTGSDVAAVSLKAKPVDGGWLLDGSKTWCTFAGRSELIVILARTNPDTSLGYKGLSMFLLEKPAYAGKEFKYEQETGGSLTGKAIATLGYRGMHSYDLFFEDFFVPAENLLGEEDGEGKGFYYTMAGFSGGRLQTAARATGVMQAAFESALSYAQQRQVFGKSVADFQLTQIKLARMLATITACRQLSYEVAESMDRGEGQMEASLVKLFACRAAEWITREAMQIHGGMGYAEESAVSRYFVDARVLSIFEGAEEVLALKVIARGLIEKV